LIGNEFVSWLWWEGCDFFARFSRRSDLVLSSNALLE
jgi:hypothetical protein